MADFSDFELARIPETEGGVYDLADGLIRDIAEGLEVPIGDEPSSGDLQAIMKEVGTNKVLRDNEEITAFDRSQMVEFVERAGVQKALNRSLWTSYTSIQDVEDVDYYVAMGAVANWQDRTADLLIYDMPPAGHAYFLGGNRVMDADSEKQNSNVEYMFNTFGRYPKEAEYIGSVITPRLTEVNWLTMPMAFETGNADEMFDKLFQQNPQLLDKKLAMARVANAGVIMAIQMRDAARKINPEFDSDPENPQVFIVTDTFPLARTESEEKLPARFQKAATALRQTVLTAKKLHETVQNL